MIFIHILSILLALIFITLGGIHFYWAVGGKWGIKYAIPRSEGNQQTINPGFLATSIVGIGLCCFGLFYLIKTAYLSIHLPAILLSIASWLVPSIFLLRAIGDFKYAGFFKRIKHTDFAKWDTLLYAPLCLFIGISGMMIAIFH